MNQERKAATFANHIKPHDAVVCAKPATPEQIRAEQEALKLKEHVDGPRNSSPL